ncbi:MAG: GNAT family N-acetyltransferase [Clostridia bacterium]|nr:GNAT family N-acetyltransferase [Clostridia bacterium]
MKIDVNRLTFQKLEIDSVPLLLEVQEEAFEYAKGNTDFLRRNTAETLSVCFEGESVVLGVFDKDTLAGFGILFVAGEGKENLAYDADEVKDVNTSANVKLIIVRPDYRGNGLQVELVKRLQESAKKSGFEWLCATVAPTNSYSYDNFVKSGFTHTKTLTKYGGLTRALFVKKI